MWVPCSVGRASIHCREPLSPDRRPYWRRLLVVSLLVVSLLVLVPLAAPPGAGHAATLRAATPALAQSDVAGSSSGAAGVAMATTPDGHGYWIAASNGGRVQLRRRLVLRLGGRADPQRPDRGDGGHTRRSRVLARRRPTAGSSASVTPRSTAPLARCVSTPRSWGWPPHPTVGGYWLVASDGGVFSFGDATFYGSTGALRLNAPIVGMAATPDGGGYWLVASDGGHLQLRRRHVLRLDRGAAPQRARSSGWRLLPTVGGTGSWRPTAASSASATPRSTARPGRSISTRRSWGWPPRPTVAGTGSSASDGGIFSFGDASFYGSATADINPLLVNELATTGGAQQVIWLTPRMQRARPPHCSPSRTTAVGGTRCSRRCRRSTG